jgi:hypothetical protein
MVSSGWCGKHWRQTHLTDRQHAAAAAAAAAAVALYVTTCSPVKHNSI